MILRLLAVNGGTIRVDDVDVSGLKGAALRDYYRRVQGVFQDPFSSCNPIFKVDHLFALLRDVYFRDLSEDAWRDKVAASLATVNLEPGQVLHKFPHQLSGGQVQRLLIARALLLDTEYLVADEIISMLDASTRIDVLNLLGDLKARGLGILFITHDLSLGNYISERTVILRRGRIVEMGTTSLVFGNPLHPYTKMLLASIPHLHDRWGTKGEVAAAWAAGAEAPLEGECLYHAVLRERPAEANAGTRRRLPTPRRRSWSKWRRATTSAAAAAKARRPADPPGRPPGLLHGRPADPSLIAGRSLPHGCRGRVRHSGP